MKLKQISIVLFFSACIGTSLAQGGESASSPLTGSPPPKVAPAGGTTKQKSRSIESIKYVFAANKGAIYSAYNKVLRENPAEQGMMEIKIRIAPSGKVESCEVLKGKGVSVEFVDALLAIIKKFDFGEMDVEPILVTYPVDFRKL